MRDSGQRKLTFSSLNHCTLRPAERLSQSEIELPLRKICYFHHLQKWESQFKLR